MKDLPAGFPTMLILEIPPANDTVRSSFVGWPDETKFELNAEFVVPTDWFKELKA